MTLYSEAREAALTFVTTGQCAAPSVVRHGCSALQVLLILVDIRNDVMKTCDLGIPYTGLRLGLGI